ncbi:MAG: hypothetical protein WCJ37_04005 [Syntrophus sp. (in: bacteria)]
MATTYVKGRLCKLKIASLNLDTDQTRKFMDPNALNELTGELMKAPWREWSEDDQNDYANALTGIRMSTGELLTDMNRTPLEEEPESTQSNGPVLA